MYRRWAREHRRAAPAPDGGGRYLAPDRKVKFELEWDRATESIDRLQEKVAAYVGSWENVRDAEQNHVLVVTPTDEREERVRRVIRRQKPRFKSYSCCTFWTTTAGRARQWGPAGAIWLRVDVWAEKAEATTLRLRTPLSQLAPVRRGSGAVEDCIGKPLWWLRRPGGGEVD